MNGRHEWLVLRYERIGFVLIVTYELQDCVTLELTIILHILSLGSEPCQNCSHYISKLLRDQFSLIFHWYLVPTRVNPVYCLILVFVVNSSITHKVLFQLYSRESTNIFFYLSCNINPRRCWICVKTSEIQNLPI